MIAIIAAAIRLDSKGPVFFRQVRVGRDGKTFRIFKFRSMVVGAEAQKEQLLALNEVGDGMFKLSRAIPVSRVSARLPPADLARRAAAAVQRPAGRDEPGRPASARHRRGCARAGLDRSRLHLTPGMTGPWQVLGSRVPMQEMVGLDYIYVANWSLWLDLKLLLHTARHVLRRGNV